MDPSQEYVPPGICVCVCVCKRFLRHSSFRKIAGISLYINQEYRYISDIAIFLRYYIYVFLRSIAGKYPSKYLIFLRSIAIYQPGISLYINHRRNIYIYINIHVWLEYEYWCEYEKNCMYIHIWFFGVHGESALGLPLLECIFTNICGSDLNIDLIKIYVWFYYECWFEYEKMNVNIYMMYMNKCDLNIQETQLLGLSSPGYILTCIYDFNVNIVFNIKNESWHICMILIYRGVSFWVSIAGKYP